MIRTYCDRCKEEKPVSEPLIGGWHRLFASMGLRDLCEGCEGEVRKWIVGKEKLLK